MAVKVERVFRVQLDDANPRILSEADARLLVARLVLELRAKASDFQWFERNEKK